MDDHELLRQYAEDHSDEAFAVLVERHVSLVYSVALRQAADPHDAEEISQAVFIILAQKAPSLRHDRALSSWLFQTTRLTANNFMRSGIRRQRREQEAYMQSLLNEPNDTWRRIAPVLDAAVAALAEKDRRAILLRFYEGRNLQDVGAILGASEDAAEKRVARALEKLRTFFAKRGVDSTTAAIAETISAHSIQAAPAGMARAITAVALAKGVATSASTATLVKGALKIMTWTKTKTAVAIGACVLLAAGTTTITVKEIQEHTVYPWEAAHWSPDLIEKVPPQVKIVPAKFPMGGMGIIDNGKMMGIGEPLWAFFPNAYHVNWTRTVCDVPLPTNHYDFIANLPQGSDEALRREIERKFGLVTTRKIFNTNVLLLTLKNTGMPGLKPAIQSPSHPLQISGNPGQFRCAAAHISNLGDFLEACFNTPVLDGTGLTGTFDIALKWNEPDPDWMPHNLDALKQDLSAQLGLELVPTNMPVEMLLVKKAR